MPRFGNHYVPSDNIIDRVGDPSEGVTTYIYEYEHPSWGPRIVTIVFWGKSAKAKEHYSHSNSKLYTALEGAYLTAGTYLAQATIHRETMAARKTAALSAKESGIAKVKPGSIFRWSWGYEQTNVDYYKVLNITPGGTATLIEVGASSVRATGPMSDSVVPNPDFEKGEPFKKRVQVLPDGTPYLSQKFGWCALDSGAPTHRSWYH